jgi:hypothetical protein
MTKEAHEITFDDLMPMNQYARTRAERRTAMVDLKKNRRVAVGPDATFYFECYETMWHQVHEMLHIERGGMAQIKNDLAAYNPLIPKGKEWVVTLMFEIDEAERRGKFLAGLGGVENTISVRFADHTVSGIPEQDVERTNAEGKASSIQFVRFPFTPDQVKKLRTPGTEVTLAIGHKKYGHMAILPQAVRAALAGDLDG